MTKPDEQGGEQLAAQQDVLDAQQQPASSQPSLEPSQEGAQGSPSELDGFKKELENLKSVLGRQGEELGELRNENAYLKSRVPQGVPQGQSPYGFQQPSAYPPPGGAESASDDYDWTDSKSVQQLIRKELGQYHALSQRERASGALTRGQMIVASNPEYFKGIESDVSQLVQGWYNMNPGVAPEMLENPQTWYGAADLLKGQKLRTSPKPPSVSFPVSPTPTEQPDATKPREPAETGERVDLGREHEDMIDVFFDGNVEEAKKAVRGERGERARREK